MNNTTVTPKTAGRFSITNGVLGGPAQYMEDQGLRLVDAIFNGQDTIYNMTAHLSPDIETAILVRLQTDYAGWIGTRQLLDSLEEPRPFPGDPQPEG